jgi:transcriptional regulator NrdR family protein
MDCPKCGKETRVIDSRQGEKHIRRRRHCDACSERVTTFERYEFDEDWLREEGREEMRQKFAGILNALHTLSQPKDDSDPEA